MVGLWEAMEEEERWSISGLDAVNCDFGRTRNGDVKLREAFKHC